MSPAQAPKIGGLPRCAHRLARQSRRLTLIFGRAVLFLPSCHDGPVALPYSSAN